MIVALGPFYETKKIRLEITLFSPGYTPSETNTVSPSTAAFIPSGIVGWSAGTRIVAENTEIVNISRQPAIRR